MDQREPLPKVEYARVTVLDIDPTSEARMKIRCRDWERIKRSIGGIPEQKNIWSNISAAALGVGIEGVLATIPMWSAGESIELCIRVAFLVLTILSFGIALVAHLAGKQRSDFITTSVDSILDDIERIEKTIPDYPLVPQ